MVGGGVFVVVAVGGGGVGGWGVEMRGEGAVLSPPPSLIGMGSNAPMVWYFYLTLTDHNYAKPR